MFPRITCFYRRNSHTLAVLALMVLTAGTARAQGGPPGSDTLVAYHFNGAVGNELMVAPSLQQTQTMSTPMRRGSGVTPAASANTFAGSNWSRPAGVVDTADYFAFHISAYTGFGLGIESLGLRERRSASGIRHWEVRSSADGFAAPLFSTAVPDTTTTRLWSVNLIPVAPFSNGVTDVEFRIYGYESEATAGTWRIDDVYLFGIRYNAGVIKPTVHFSAATQTVAESAGTLQIPVTITDPVLNRTTVRVELAQVLGTATDSVDYTFAPQTLTFLGGGGPGGGFPQQFTLKILEDALPESAETVLLQLTTISAGSVIGNPSLLVVTITDNDGGPPSPTLLRPIVTATPITPQGLATRLGQAVRIRGIVAAPDQRQGGYQTTLIDRTRGVGLFRSTTLGTRTMAIGDSLEVVGVVTQFEGFTQVAVDSFRTLLTNQLLPAAPRVITVLDETTESALIKIVGPLHVVNPLQWIQTGTSFAVDVTDGISTYVMRVVQGTTVYSASAPTGSFSLTGIGGQSDATAPYTTSYDIVPRSLADITVVTGLINAGPVSQGLTLYPNPVADHLTIEATGANHNPVTVIDASGRVVLRAPAGATSLRVTELPTGLSVRKPGVS